MNAVAISTQTETTGGDCPECAGSVREDGSETVCSDCGLVVDEDAIDHGKEWRAHNEKERQERRRVGLPRTVRLHDHGVGSEISFGNVDTNGNQLSASKKYKFNRIRKWAKRLHFEDKVDRNRAAGLAEVRRICDALSLSDSHVDRACKIWHEAHGAGLAIGRSIDEFVAASVLAAVREDRYPLTGDVLLEHVQLQEPQRSKLFAAYQMVLDETSASPTFIEPVDYVAQMASKLDVDEETRREVQELVLDLQEENIHVGKRPAAVAGAAFYHLLEGHGVEITQYEAADVAEVSTTTVRERVRDIEEADIHA